MAQADPAEVDAKIEALPVFASTAVTVLIAGGSALLLRPAWLAIPLWAAMASIARAMGAAGGFGKTLRRLAIPALIVLASASIAQFLPTVFAALVIALSLPFAGWQARVARYTGAGALGVPLILLAAALLYSLSTSAQPW